MEPRNKKIIYIDMDGVLVDFKGAIEKAFKDNPEYLKTHKTKPDQIPNIFKDPKPFEGAKEAIKQLADSGLYEMFIATTATWDNHDAATHKKLWLEKHFGKTFRKRMFITHRKDLLKGDYLIDDRKENGAKDFDGQLLPFGWNYLREKWNKYPRWDDILEKLAEDNEEVDWDYEGLLHQCLTQEIGHELIAELEETGLVKYYSFTKRDIRCIGGPRKYALEKPRIKSEYRVEYYFKRNKKIDHNKFQKAYITKLDEKNEFYVIWDTKFLKAGGAWIYHFRMTKRGCTLLREENSRCY
jgi:5'-nucleotidase